MYGWIQATWCLTRAVNLSKQSQLQWSTGNESQGANGDKGGNLQTTDQVLYLNWGHEYNNKKQNNGVYIKG